LGRAGAQASLYNMSVAANESGGTITVDLAIANLSGGNYQANQWNLDYNESLVSFVSAAATGPAPSACDLASPSDNGDRLLVGCIDFAGDNISFFGVAFTATFSCIGTGTADFNLTNIDIDTFVQKTTGIQPITVTNDSVTCGGAAPTATPTPTITPTSTPSPIGSPQATATFVFPDSTNTPVATGTPSPGEATPPPPGDASPTPPAGGGGTGGGGGAGGGVVQPPDTGAGSPTGSERSQAWVLLVAGVGVAIVGTGVVALRRRRQA
jgi:hypothetical protein